MKKFTRISMFLLLITWLMPLSANAANMVGDVNGDGEVNIADINAVIDIILGGNGDFEAADVNGDHEVNIADVNVIIDIILRGSGSTPNHEYVDLGLPSGTLWATTNVGANTPEGYGDYFAWGETKPKEVYTWETYKWCLGSMNNMTKYCTKSGFGTIDNKTELDPEDDAAYVNWGSSWCMPSLEMIDELIENCTWEWTQMNGVDGQLGTGPNGNTIFLPAAGFRQGGSFGDVGSGGCYWSRTLGSDEPIYAFDWGFTSENVYRSGYPRYCGFTVRAVRVPVVAPIYIEQKSLNLGDVPLEETATGELSIINNTTESQTVTVTADAPFMLKQGEGSVASITVSVSGNSNRSVEIVFTATEPGEFNGNVTFQNPLFEGGQCVIPIQARAIIDTVPQHEYVDLGLPSGTLWATTNVGANTPEGYGDYFAWGETKPKEIYTWDTYNWCTIENTTELDSEDDAAYVNWGESWRMPSLEMIDELIEKCTWEWTQRNGVNGQLGTGPNGNTIFLPAAGFRQGASFGDVDSAGCYWSRTINSDENYAFDWGFTSENVYRSCYPRYCGFTVRAVRRL